MKKAEGIKSITVSFPTKWATVEFDESKISAQEVSRAMFLAPHAMGKDMRYGGFLLLRGSDKTLVFRKYRGLESENKLHKQPRLSKHCGLQGGDHNEHACALAL